MAGPHDDPPLAVAPDAPADLAALCTDLLAREPDRPEVRRALASLLLARYHSTNWLWFTAFVGFNLLQSSLTRFCPLEIILRKLGVGRAQDKCCS